MTRCPRCGNEIPDWSVGVCPVCERRMSTEKRFWGRGTKYSRPPRRAERSQATPAFMSGRRQPNTAKMLLKPKSRGRRRLEGFNRLLLDVYGGPTRLSDLLVRQGLTRKQVTQWRQDGLWLVRFLKRLEGKLLVLLAQVLSHHDPRVLSLWYGLDGQDARALGAVALELGMTKVEAQLAHDLQMRYLRRDEGRAALEGALLGAAQETERNDRRGD